ncbi:MAG TPA: hypothetical protein PKD72_08765, partial [Gemmatales bacterium]|nr:hypothetical protein [Gemmatales bacterium]
MGKIFDSMRQRISKIPGSAMEVATPLQVLADHQVMPVNDHESMPYYEVPNDAESKTGTLPFHVPTRRQQTAEPTRENKSRRVSLIPAEPIATHANQHIAEELIVIHQPRSAEALEYRAIAEQLLQELNSLQANSITLLPV